MERTTKAHVQSAFSRLAEVCGKRIASSYDDVGAWHLHRGFRGWEIQEIVSPGGSWRHPLGERQLSNSAMYDACWCAIRAIEAYRLAAGCRCRHSPTTPAGCARVRR